MGVRVLLATLFVSAYFCQICRAQNVVQTQSGQVTGKISMYSGGDVVEYLGIPYAEAPVANKRFLPPIEKSAWNGTINATNYGAVCPQDMDSLQIYSKRQFTTDEDVSDVNNLFYVSEDCLSLNVFAPKETPTDLLPVIVYLHGGEFSFGTGSLFNGAVLCREYAVVMVTINYRLGAFGFLSDGTDEMPGNYGMLDQQLALKWVQHNIKNFGGDGTKITLMGEGEGGSSTHLHMACDGSNQLFNKAIIQAASYDDQLWNENRAHENYREFLNKTSSSSLKELRNLTWEELQVASAQLQWSPVTNQNFVLESTRNILSKESSGTNMNVLVGSNNKQGITLSQNQINGVLSNAWYMESVMSLANRAFPQQYPNITQHEANNLLQSYVAYYAGYGALANIPFLDNILNEEIYTDQLYTTWAHEISSLQSYGGGDVYSYQFSAASPIDDGGVWVSNDAAPGDDLTYVFGFLLSTTPATSIIQQNVASAMMTYWTNFAKTGNPNGGDQVSWPRYQTENSNESLCRQVIIIDDGSDVAADIQKTQFKETSRSWQFWQKYYEFIGFSCTNVVAVDIEEDNSVDYPACENGVWSDAGVEMSNETAGNLLITFICLTAFFLILFLICWIQNSKIKKKIKKVVGDGDNSSTYSNDDSHL